MNDATTCRQCNSPLPDGARFCPVCGKEQDIHKKEDSSAAESSPRRFKKLGTHLPPPPPPDSGAKVKASEGTANSLPPPPTVPDTTVPADSEHPAYSAPSWLRRGIAFLIDTLLVLAPFLLLYFIEPLRNVLMESYFQYIDYGDIIVLDQQTYYATAVVVFLVILWSLAYTLTRDGGGRSIGKRFTGLMVIHQPTCRPITRGRSFLRNLLWVLPGINLTVLAADAFLISQRCDRRRSGDLLAATQVIHSREYSRNTKRNVSDF